MLATDALGDFANSVVWDAVPGPSSSLLRKMSEESSKLLADVRGGADNNTAGDAAVLKIGTMMLAAMMEHAYEVDRINKLKEAASEAALPPPSKAVAGKSGKSGGKSGKASKSGGGGERKGKGGGDFGSSRPSQYRASANVDDWPVFLCASFKLVPASALIWPEQQFYDLPEDVQATLRRHAASASASAEFLHPELRAQLASTTVPSSRHGGRGNGGGGGRRRDGGPDHQPKVRPPVAAVLARKYLERCQASEHGGGTVSIVELSRRCFAAIASRTPTAADVADVMTLTRFAKDSSLPEMIGHVLVGSSGGGGGGRGNSSGGDEQKRLVPVGKATLGSAYGHALLQDAAGADLLYVIRGYDSYDSYASAAGPTPSATRRWVAFFDSCGVHSSISFEGYHDGSPTSTDIKSLPDAKLPPKRASNKTIPFPYEIAGMLTKNTHAIIDFKFSTGWSSIFKRALAVSDPASRHAKMQAFATLLSRCSFDHNEHVTKELVPALAPGIRGEGSSGDGGGSSGSGGGRGGPKRGRGDGATSATYDTPSRRRCLYLPPAHPGLSAADCGRAQWASGRNTLP